MKLIRNISYILAFCLLTYSVIVWVKYLGGLSDIKKLQALVDADPTGLLTLQYKITINLAEPVLLNYFYYGSMSLLFGTILLFLGFVVGKKTTGTDKMEQEINNLQPIVKTKENKFSLRVSNGEVKRAGAGQFAIGIKIDNEEEVRIDNGNEAIFNLKSGNHKVVYRFCTFANQYTKGKGKSCTAFHEFKKDTAIDIKFQYESTWGTFKIVN